MAPAETNRQWLQLEVANRERVNVERANVEREEIVNGRDAAETQSRRL
jgi:hypothetical protein